MYATKEVSSLLPFLVSGMFIMVINSCASFDKKNLHRHIGALASDEFDGRAPLSDGEKITLHYLDQEFRNLGVNYLPGASGYNQEVPLARIKTQVIGPISFAGINLLFNEEIVVTSESLNETVTLSNVPIVFVGFGITAPEFEWDDYKSIDVKNKIVVMLVSDPGFYEPSLFRGKNTTYYGRWTYKLEEAKRRGALGAFVIHEKDAAGYGFHVVQQKHHQLVLKDQKNNLSVQGWLSIDAVRKVFAYAKLDFAQVKQKALKGQGFTASLGHLNLVAKNNFSAGVSHNICGFIEGKNTKHHALISAHWDHLGSHINEQGTKDIYRGAVDNGTGVAALLELARHYSVHKPHINLVFCSFTAEEQGLLGAKYFIKQPPIPLNTISGMLNFDCLNVGDTSNVVTFYGPPENKLYNLIAAEVRKQGRSLVHDAQGSKGYFYRSDHFPFAQNDIPALLFMDIGISDPNYLEHHYHQPSDAHNSSWSLNGMVQDLELFKNIIDRI